MTTQPPTLADLEALLEARGLPLSEIRAVRLWPTRPGDRSSPLEVQVDRYVLNSEGERFAVRLAPGRDAEVAFETLVMPLLNLPEVGNAEVRDENIDFYQSPGKFMTRPKSAIVEEQGRVSPNPKTWQWSPETLGID